MLCVAINLANTVPIISTASSAVTLYDKGQRANPFGSLCSAPGGRLHWWSTALVVDCTGGQLHWWSAALVVGCTGGRLHWWSAALVVGCTGGRLHWWSAALVVGCTGGRLHWWSAVARTLMAWSDISKAL